MFDSPFMTIDELAKLIRKSAASIYSDLHRNPSSLPPSIRLPGSRRVLFDPQSVRNWIDKHTTTVSGLTDAIQIAPRNCDGGKKTESDTNRKRRGPGRPTKAEQLDRKLREGGSR